MAMLSSRTWSVSALVARLARTTGIARMAGVAAMSGIARVTPVACLTGITSLSGLALWSLLAGRSGRSRLPLHGRCLLLWSWGLVAAAKYAHHRD
jgi:hypothetical protein